MESVAVALALLACPLGMGLMGWFMVKGMRKSDNPTPDTVDDLRTEHRRLGAEIERLERARHNGGDVPAVKR